MLLQLRAEAWVFFSSFEKDRTTHWRSAAGAARRAAAPRRAALDQSRGLAAAHAARGVDPAGPAPAGPLGGAAAGA